MAQEISIWDIPDILQSRHRFLKNRVPESWLPVEELGTGVYGVAYSTEEPNVVVKFTTDDTEMDFIRKVKRSTLHPGVVNIYTYCKIPDYHLWGIWRERVDLCELPYDDVRLLDNIMVYIQDRDWYLAKSYLKRAKRTKLRLVAEAMEFYAAQGSFLTDVHSGNIGYARRGVRGRLVIFDFGCCSTVAKNHAPKILVNSP